MDNNYNKLIKYIFDNFNRLKLNNLRLLIIVLYSFIKKYMR
jgi:hypothetical protein